MTSTLPDSTSPTESAISPARSRNASFGKRSVLVPRQESIAVSSFSETPEKSGDEAITGKNSSMKIPFR